ncbi:MAG: hypothetical protein MK211_11310 [Flavobacteriales bacterium]|nr:hypothetical protein [Flavobacteriales bacterium]
MLIMNQGGDAQLYWFESYNFRYFTFDEIWEMVLRGSAAGNLLLINYFPAKVLELSFFTGNIIYGVLGYFSFVFIFAIIKENYPDIYKLKKNKILGISLFPTFLFLPNLHFWTAGIGKDTLLFLCIALFAYSVGNIRKRIIGIIVSVLIGFTVRPHIVLFLVVAFGIAYALAGNLKGYQKVFIFVLFLLGFSSIFNYVVDFVQLENIELNTIQNFTEKKARNLGGGAGSAVDLNNYSYPFKVFTFLYRPLFFDAMNVLGLVASFENLLWLIFSIKLFKSNLRNGFKNASVQIKGLCVFFIIGACSFSLILGNLGIILRQKTPFIIALLVFGYGVFLNKRKQSV